MALIRPGAEIDELAALAAKGAPRFAGLPFDRLATGWTFHGGTHSEQQLSLKLISSSTGTARYRARVRIGRENLSKTFARENSARAWIRRMEGQIEEGEVVGLSAIKTLEEAVAAYRSSESWERLSTNDRKTRSTRLDWWLEWFGAARLKEVTVGAIEDALADLRRGKSPSGRRLSSTTRLHYLVPLSCALRLAVRRGWLKVNPCDGVERPQARRGRERYLRRQEDAPELGVDELVDLLQACRASRSRRLYPALVITLATGCRQSELFRHAKGTHTQTATWEDTVLRATGPAGEDLGARIHIRESKSRRPKTLVLLHEVAEALREYAKVRPLHARFLMETKKGSVAFPKAAWSGALGRAGLDDFRWHDLRHSCGSYLGMQGYSVFEIAQVLGCTIDTAARYTHLSTSTQERTAAAGVEALRGALRLVK